MKRKILRTTVIATASTFLTLLLNVLINIWTSQETPFSHLSGLWIIVLVLIFSLLSVVVSVFERGNSDSSSEVAPIPLTALQRRENRARLLEKVHHDWIKGLLDQSLYHQARIALGLRTQPDALFDPWRLALHEQGHAPRQLPSRTRILQIYDQAQGELLILGEPGSGKTTLLLELARALLRRANSSEDHPLPVIFPLAGWAEKRLPLHEWLVEELYRRYQVPRAIGREWVAQEQILPLLDGLDEVAAPARAACIEAINTFQRDHGAVPTVVCSRSADYFALGGKLQLREAVTIQPLTDQQLDTFFQQAGPSFAEIQAALHADSVLRELLTTPLILDIIALAYQGSPPDPHLLQGTLEERRAHLFTTYIQQMLKRHQRALHYPPERFWPWLHWLAKHMADHHQTTFYLEELRDDWTSKPNLVRPLAGLLVGLPVYLFCILTSVPVVMQIGYHFLIGLFFGLAFEGIVWFMAGKSIGIRPVEKVHWSRKSLQENLRGKRFSLVMLVLTAVLLVGFVGWQFGNPSIGLLFGLIVLVLFVALAVLTLGLSHNLSKKIEYLTPNQGIKSSMQNGLLFGLSTGILIGLLLGLFLFPFGLFTSLLFGSIGGFLVGLLFALYAGLAVCIQHAAIRILLWRANAAPLRYVRFLNDAVHCILLRRVGGGYLFIHRLLLDHFAALDDQALRALPTNPRLPQTPN